MPLSRVVLGHVARRTRAPSTVPTHVGSGAVKSALAQVHDRLVAEDHTLFHATAGRRNDLTRRSPRRTPQLDLWASPILLVCAETVALNLATEDVPLSPLLDSRAHEPDGLTVGMLDDSLLALQVIAESYHAVRADGPQDILRAKDSRG